MGYIQFFKDSIKEAFENMFSEVIELERESTAPRSILSKGVTVIIGITGEKKGRVLLDLSLPTATELANIIDTDLKEEDLTLFTMSELCNIASGGAITGMNNENKQLVLRLVPPSIFAGINTEIFSPNLNSTLLSYNTQFGKVDFHVGFEGV